MASPAPPQNPLARGQHPEFGSTPPSLAHSSSSLASRSTASTSSISKRLASRGQPVLPMLLCRTRQAPIHAPLRLHSCRGLHLTRRREVDLAWPHILDLIRRRDPLLPHMVELMWLTKCGEALANLGDLEMPCGSSSGTCSSRSSASVSPFLSVLRKCTTAVKCHGIKNREEIIF
jgi:hypothetical protein